MSEKGSRDLPPDSQQHSHSHAAELKAVSDARLLWAVLLNQLLTVGQVVASILSGSIALLSDAAHNFNDANALLIAYIARRVSRKKANHSYTFGYRRAEMIGALVNLTLLSVMGVFLVYEGVKRIIQPEEVIGWIMAVTAVVALVVDLGTAVLLWVMSKGSLNVRAAFIHNVVDALGSLAVLLGAGAIIWFEWMWVDPIITLMIAAYVLWQVYKMFPQAVRLLMNSTPIGLDVEALQREIEKLDKVLGIHHLHVWDLDEQSRTLEAHIVIAGEDSANFEQIKKEIKQLLKNHYHIEHSTLEFEFPNSSVRACIEGALISDH